MLSESTLMSSLFLIVFGALFHLALCGCQKSFPSDIPAATPEKRAYDNLKLKINGFSEANVPPSDPGIL